MRAFTWLIKGQRITRQITGFADVFASRFVLTSYKSNDHKDKCPFNWKGGIHVDSNYLLIKVKHILYLKKTNPEDLEQAGYFY